MALREADAALLVRLRSELALESLCRAEGITLPARAAGLWLALENSGPDLSARAGHPPAPAALRERARPARLAGLPPAAVHHIALFERALCRAPRAPEQLTESLTRVMAAWLALGAERRYVRTLATHVIGQSGPDVERALDAVMLRGLELTAAEVRAGLGKRTERSKLALAALARASHAVVVSGISGELADRFVRQAALVHCALVDEALAASRAELADLATRDWSLAEAITALSGVSEVWRWSDQSPEVEHYVVTVLPDFAWELHRKKAWRELEALLACVEGPIERLSLRLRSPDERSAHDAYAARASQAMVFRAETAPDLEAQIARAKVAYDTCPTLRNARLVYADFLTVRVERTLRVPRSMRSRTHEMLADDLSRARAAFPELSRLAQVEAQLAADRGGA